MALGTVQGSARLVVFARDLAMFAEAALGSCLALRGVLVFERVQTFDQELEEAFGRLRGIAFVFACLMWLRSSLDIEHNNSTCFDLFSCI